MEEVLDAEGTPEGAAPIREECRAAQEEWVKRCQGWKRDYPVVLPRHLEGGTGTQANVYAFAYEMSRRLNEGQIVVVGNGSANVVCGHGNIMKKGQRFIWIRASGRDRGQRGRAVAGHRACDRGREHSDESAGVTDSDRL